MVIKKFGLDSPGPNMSFKSKDIKKQKKSKKKVKKGGYSMGGGGIEMSMEPKGKKLKKKKGTHKKLLARLKAGGYLRSGDEKASTSSLRSVVMDSMMGGTRGKFPPEGKKGNKILAMLGIKKMNKMCLTKKGELFIKGLKTSGYFDKDMKKKKKKKMKKEAPSSPGVGAFIKSDSPLIKAFEDRWLLEIGDEFRKITASHQQPFEFINRPEGTVRNYIFKVGDCEVIYSIMGKDAKMKLNHPEKPNADHFAIAKHLYSKIMGANFPLQKGEGGAAKVGGPIKIKCLNKTYTLTKKGEEIFKARSLYGNQYSTSWQEGLGEQQNRRRKQVQRNKERGKGYRRPSKSIAQRRLAETGRRLMGAMEERKNVGKTIEKEDVGKKHQLKIARQTLKMTPEGAKIMGGMDHKEARKIIAQSKMKKGDTGEKLGHSMWHIAENNKDGTATIHGKVSAPHSVSAVRRFKEENPNYNDASLQAWIVNSSAHMKKERLNKRGREFVQAFSKAFGLAPQTSRLKHTQGTRTGKGRINISARASSGISAPQVQKAKKKMKKMGGAPAISPSNPKIATPSIDTPKGGLKKVRKKKMKKVSGLTPSSRSTGTGQGNFEA